MFLNVFNRIVLPSPSAIVLPSLSAIVPPIPQCNCPEGRNARDCFSTLRTKFLKAWRMSPEKEAAMEKTQFNLRAFKRNIPQIIFEFF